MDPVTTSSMLQPGGVPGPKPDASQVAALKRCRNRPIARPQHHPGDIHQAPEGFAQLARRDEALQSRQQRDQVEVKPPNDLETDLKVASYHQKLASRNHRDRQEAIMLHLRLFGP